MGIKKTRRKLPQKNKTKNVPTEGNVFSFFKLWASALFIGVKIFPQLLLSSFSPASKLRACMRARGHRHQREFPFSFPTLDTETEKKRNSQKKRLAELPLRPLCLFSSHRLSILAFTANRKLYTCKLLSSTLPRRVLPRCFFAFWDGEEKEKKQKQNKKSSQTVLKTRAGKKKLKTFRLDARSVLDARP